VGFLATTTVAARMRRSRILQPLRSCWRTAPSGTSADSTWETASWIERLAGGVDLLDAGVGQHALHLRKDHLDASLEGIGRRALGGTGGLHGHLEVVHHGEEFGEDALLGVADGVVAVAGGAFAVVVHVRGEAEEAVPMLVGLGGLGLEVRDLFGGQRLRRHGAAFGRLVGGRALRRGFRC
jgi:hypothetical protein